MQVKSAACTSCGAPLDIAPDVESLTCAYCGARLIVERGQGRLAPPTGGVTAPGRRPAAHPNWVPGEGAARPTGVAIPSHSPRDWTVALALCLLFGIFGVHRFYSGHWLIGLVQLFTSGGFGLWWLIDLSLILSGRYRDSTGLLLERRDPAVALGCAWAIVGLFGLFIAGVVLLPLDARDSLSAFVAVAALATGLVIFVLGYRRARGEQTEGR